MLTQSTFPLGSLLGQDMLFVGLVSLQLARSGQAESLGRPTVGLHLGHLTTSFLRPHPMA